MALVSALLSWLAYKSPVIPFGLRGTVAQRDAFRVTLTSIAKGVLRDPSVEVLFTTDFDQPFYAIVVKQQGCLHVSIRGTYSGDVRIAYGTIAADLRTTLCPLLEPIQRTVPQCFLNDEFPVAVAAGAQAAAIELAFEGNLLVNVLNLCAREGIRNIEVMGHSLGGQIAPILGAMIFGACNRDLPHLNISMAVRTFGAPTTGNYGFAWAYDAMIASNRVSSTRYFNVGDPISYLWCETTRFRARLAKIALYMIGYTENDRDHGDHVRHGRWEVVHLPPYTLHAYKEMDCHRARFYCNLLKNPHPPNLLADLVRPPGAQS